MSENELATVVVDCCYKIHRSVGPGLMERTYERFLALELQSRGIQFERQKAISVTYNKHRVDFGFRADLVVANKLIVEIKSVELLAPVHFKQLLTYLRFAEIRLGLLVNFNEALIKNGIRRIANNL